MKRLNKALIILVIFSFIAQSAALCAGEEQMQVTGAVGEGQEASQYLNGKIQAGYFVPTFVQIDRVQAQRVDRRNGVEHMLVSSYKADDHATMNIYMDRAQHEYNSQLMAAEMAQRAAETVRVADANSMNRYRPYEDGKVEYYQDGLVTRIDNERVTDDFGNISRKNTYNFTYNDNRMLTGYEAMTTNAVGVSTYERLFGVTYTADSVYWGNYNTDANQHRTAYNLQVTDALGNNRLMHWQTDDANYIGKYLHAFSETIDDDLYGHHEFTQSDIRYESETRDPRRATSYHEYGVRNGLVYSKDRSDITYNMKNQILGYHDDLYEGWEGVEGDAESWDSHTVTDAEYTYEDWKYRPDDSSEEDPDRITGIVTKSYRMDSDKSWKGTAEDPTVSITTYTYDDLMKLVNASTTEQYIAGDEFNNLSIGSSETFYSLDYKMYYGTPVAIKTTSVTDSYERPTTEVTESYNSLPNAGDGVRYSADIVPDLVTKYAANGGPNGAIAYNPAWGARRHEESTLNYVRNDYGVLIGANDSSTFVGDTGLSDNIYWGTTSNEYTVMFQEPKVTVSTTVRNSQLENDDWSQATLTTHYYYNDNGQIVLKDGDNASGTTDYSIGYSQGTGYYTITNNPEKPNTYEVIHGKLKETFKGTETTTSATQIKKPFEDADYQSALDEYAKHVLKTKN